MITKLKKDYPKYKFAVGKDFIWSPNKETIYYDPERISREDGQWSLLHELGHAILGHKDYVHDIDLLQMELEAWEKAKELTVGYSKPKVKQDYIESCLDSYRDWLKKRSTCPECSYVNFQSDHSTYTCFNCSCIWKVPVSQICKIRRRKQTGVVNK